MFTCVRKTRGTPQPSAWRLSLAPATSPALAARPQEEVVANLAGVDRRVGLPVGEEVLHRPRGGEAAERHPGIVLQGPGAGGGKEVAALPRPVEPASRAPRCTNAFVHTTYHINEDMEKVQVCIGMYYFACVCCRELNTQPKYSCKPPLDGAVQDGTLPELPGPHPSANTHAGSASGTARLCHRFGSKQRRKIQGQPHTVAYRGLRAQMITP